MLCFSDTISYCGQDSSLNIGSVIILKKYQIHWGQDASFQNSYLIFLTDFKCIFQDNPQTSGVLLSFEDAEKGFRCKECKEVVGYAEDLVGEMLGFLQIKHCVCVVNVDSVIVSKDKFDENCCWQSLNCRECERELGRFYVSCCREKMHLNGSYFVEKDRVFVGPVEKKRETVWRQEQEEAIKKPEEVERAIKSFKEMIGDLQNIVNNLEETYSFMYSRNYS